MSPETTLWIALSAVAAVATGGFFARVRYRLRRRPTYRPSRDGWQRAFPNLVGLCLSLLALGFALGGAWFDRPSPTAPPIGEPLRATRSPTPTGPASADPASGDPAADRTDTSGAPGRAAATASEDRGGAEPPGTVADPGNESPAGGGSAAAPRDPAIAEFPAEASFAVRVGVFGNPANANAVVADLAAAGFRPVTVRRSGSTGDPLYYVYADAYASREQAETAAELVRALGSDALVVEIRDPAGA